MLQDTILRTLQNMTLYEVYNNIVGAYLMDVVQMRFFKIEVNFTRQRNHCRVCVSIKSVYVFTHINSQHSIVSILSHKQVRFEEILKWKLEFEKLMEKLVMSFVCTKMWQSSQARETFLWVFVKACMKGLKLWFSWRHVFSIPYVNEIIFI